MTSIDLMMTNSMHTAERERISQFHRVLSNFTSKIGSDEIWKFESATKINFMTNLGENYKMKLNQTKQ